MDNIFISSPVGDRDFATAVVVRNAIDRWKYIHASYILWSYGVQVHKTPYTRRPTERERLYRDDDDDNNNIVTATIIERLRPLFAAETMTTTTIIKIIIIWYLYNNTVESSTSHMARSRERRRKKGLEKSALRRHSREGGGRWTWRFYRRCTGYVIVFIRTLKSPPAIMICILAVNASYFCREHNRSSVYRFAASRNAIL